MNSFLGFIASLRPLPEDLVNHLQQIMKRRAVTKGHYVCWPGHTCKRVYYVEKGVLRCFFPRGKREHCCRIITEGKICTSAESFFNQQESKERIQALEDCVLQSLSYKELENIYERFPVFNATGRLLMQKCYLETEGQRFWEKAYTAEERYRWLEDRNPELILRLPLRYIASYLGISDVMLSRIRAKRIS